MSFNPAVFFEYRDPVSGVVIETITINPLLNHKYNPWSGFDVVSAKKTTGNVGQLRFVSPAKRTYGVLTLHAEAVDDAVAKRLLATTRGYDLTQDWPALTLRFYDPYGNVWRVKWEEVRPLVDDARGELDFDFQMGVESGPTVLTLKTACDP